MNLAAEYVAAENATTEEKNCTLGCKTAIGGSVASVAVAGACCIPIAAGFGTGGVVAGSAAAAAQGPAVAAGSAFATAQSAGATGVFAGGAASGTIVGGTAAALTASYTDCINACF